MGSGYVELSDLKEWFVDGRERKVRLRSITLGVVIVDISELGEILQAWYKDRTSRWPGPEMQSNGVYARVVAWNRVHLVDD